MGYLSDPGGHEESFMTRRGPLDVRAEPTKREAKPYFSIWDKLNGWVNNAIAHITRDALAAYLIFWEIYEAPHRGGSSFDPNALAMVKVSIQMDLALKQMKES